MAKATVKALVEYMEEQATKRRKTILSGSLATLEDYRGACAAVKDLESTISHAQKLAAEDAKNEEEE
jgi:hypothetical protein